MKRLLLLATILLVSTSQISALKITEVQFDPSGTDTDREWVEVYNDGASAIDFSKYKFFEANVNHSLTALSVATLEAGEYAVVIQDAAKFFADYPNFTGKAFISSFSLSNTGEALAFKTASGAVADSYTYNPSASGAGNGLSEQLVNSVWTKGAATPGLANTASFTPPVDTSTTITSTTTATTSATTATTSASPTVIVATVTETIEVPKIVYVQKSYWPVSEKIYVNAGPNKLTVTGAEVQFEGRIYDADTKSQVTTGEFRWSFGDGTEAIGSRGAKHVYKFPGEYTAVFQATSDGRFEEDRLYVKVVNPEISLKMGRELDLDYVEITNNYNEELKLDDFLLTQLDQNGLVLKRFALPKGFSILPKRSIKIDLNITQFVGPIVAVGLSYSSDIQLAKAHNLNLKNDTQELAQGNLSTTTSAVLVYTPGNEPNFIEQPTTQSASTTTTTVQVQKTPIRKKVTYISQNKIAASSSPQSTNPDNPSSVTTSTNSPSKTILSKQSPTFWQSVKSFLGI